MKKNIILVSLTFIFIIGLFTCTFASVFQDDNLLNDSFMVLAVTFFVGLMVVAFMPEDKERPMATRR